MGYSATLLSVQSTDSGYANGNGYALPVLLSANLPQVLTALHAAEQVIGSHISWCEPIHTYTGTPAEIISSVLSDYGWENTEYDPETGNVDLGYWGGDKLGSCWDTILSAIAIGIDPALTVTLFMSGEDGELWAERLHAGHVETLQVRLEVVQP